MTDVGVLTAASDAAHRFFDEYTQGKAALDQSNDYAFEAYAAIVGETWWRADREQLTLFRYHFAVKLIALGLVWPLRLTSPK